MSKKKRSTKKHLKNLIKKNRVWVAALGGAAAGIALTSLLGTEKAKQVLASVENNLKDFSNTLKHRESRNDANLAGA